MKNLVKSLAVASAAIMVLGLGVHRADASGVDLRIGVNFGIPVVAATVFNPAPVYVHRPVRAYQVEKVRFTERERDYRYDRNRHAYVRHAGWNGDHRGQNLNHHDERGR